MTPRELFGPQITKTSDSKPVLKNDAVPDVINDITPRSFTEILPSNFYQGSVGRDVVNDQ